MGTVGRYSSRYRLVEAAGGGTDSHEDMDERVEGAAEVRLPSRGILNNQEPHREECRGVVVDVQEADLNNP